MYSKQMVFYKVGLFLLLNIHLSYPDYIINTFENMHNGLKNSNYLYIVAVLCLLS